ncbi:hypothetical protein ACFL5Z_08580 [Planctomycetota bacterium]
MNVKTIQITQVLLLVVFALAGLIFGYVGDNNQISIIVGWGATLLLMIDLTLHTFSKSFIDIDAPRLFKTLQRNKLYTCLQEEVSENGTVTLTTDVFPKIIVMIHALDTRDHVFTTSTFYPGKDYEEALIEKVWHLHRALGKKESKKTILTRIICRNQDTESWLDEIRNPKEDCYKNLAKLISYGRVKLYIYEGYLGLDFILIERRNLSKVIMGIKEDHPNRYSKFGEATDHLSSRGLTYYFEKNVFPQSIHNYLYSFLLPKCKEWNSAES